ncbi:hypothetical protein HAPAU_39060 [Halalkalicoccus paucihalophilus]|uniref:Uncharacterized protein n=1 Tax=Halalkalicoccus paucihalophilus TaxID=1008153 RepID=A0A151A8W6_9EURY|nr:hypothetical protein HAPAU_39060 [Halalkalicoccus paucihalophilus]
MHMERRICRFGQSAGKTGVIRVPMCYEHMLNGR